MNKVHIPEIRWRNAESGRVSVKSVMRIVILYGKARADDGHYSYYGEEGRRINQVSREREGRVDSLTQ